jgi:hypothetical protein
MIYKVKAFQDDRELTRQQKILVEDNWSMIEEVFTCNNDKGNLHILLINETDFEAIFRISLQQPGREEEKCTKKYNGNEPPHLASIKPGAKLRVRMIWLHNSSEEAELASFAIYFHSVG